MNLREMIGEYVMAHMQCQEVIGMEGEVVERIRRRFGESKMRLDNAFAMAEAAVACAEYVASNSDTDIDERLCELVRLWGVFLESRAKAKAAEQS